MAPIAALVFVVTFVVGVFAYIGCNKPSVPKTPTDCIRHEMRETNDVYECKIDGHTCFIYRTYGISCL